MKRKFLLMAVAAIAMFLAAPSTFAAEVDAALKAKLVAKFAELKALAADPAIVDTVASHNKALTPDESAMTQEKWKSLPILDPFIRAYSKNKAAEVLKARQAKDPALSEAFISGADGTKVAFLAKTSGWSHKGKPKHDQPMAGKDFTGPVEVDESTGISQIQIAVPVLSGGKPVGSLVAGYAVTKLK